MTDGKKNRNKVVLKILTITFYYSEKEKEKDHYSVIGIFQAFVGVVQANMAVLEECVNKAEDEMGSLSGLKKMLSSFVGPVSCER